MRLGTSALEHIAHAGALVDDRAPAAKLGEMQHHAREQLLWIDRRGEGARQRLVELLRMWMRPEG